MWGGWLFQNPASFQAVALDVLHDYVCGLSLVVLVTTGGTMALQASSQWVWGVFVDSPQLEFFWTFFPILILVAIGVPGLFVLYSHETETNSSLSVKVTGHQWYWSYSVADFQVEFDSFLVPTASLPLGGSRLLEVDNPLVLPVGVGCRILVTSADVLHAWALPSLSLKADAAPGRLNGLSTIPDQVGMFYGQCSEICGVNHSFMPIAVEVTGGGAFSAWLVGSA